MKTDDLIRGLAADSRASALPVGRIMARTLPLAIGLSLVLFQVGMKARPDLMTALSSWRFDLKMLLAVSLALTAAWLVMRLARPSGDTTLPARAVLAVPLVLVGAVGLELALLPRAAWVPHAVGTNAMWCLASIPVFALAPLVAMLIALRNGATRSPAASGAIAGLMAGALGAAIYGTHCWDDSPLFVAIWYPLGIAAVAILGALAGSRVLRW